MIDFTCNPRIEMWKYILLYKPCKRSSELRDVSERNITTYVLLSGEVLSGVINKAVSHSYYAMRIRTNPHGPGEIRGINNRSGYLKERRRTIWK